MTTRPAAVLLLAVLAGCSSSGTVPSPSPVATPVATPSGSVGLRGVGLAHGPDDLFLPAGLPAVVHVDQPNVVAVTVPTGEGPSTARWLVAHLPAQGYTVDAAKDTSVTFHGTDWRGALTCSDTLCALALRNQPS